MGFLFVVVAVVVIACVLAMIALAFGTGFGLLTGSRLSSGNSKPTHGLPACGRCGYPARGISGLNCPECGADLREVGISLGRSHQLVGAGCIVSIVFTIALVIVASILNPMIVNLFPDYETQSFSIRLSPNSQAFGEAFLHVDASELIPSNSINTGLGGTSTTWNQSGTGGRTTTVSLGTGGGQRTVNRVAFSARYNPRSKHAWKEIFFEVNPQSLEAAWTDQSGNPRSSNGVFSDQDMLAYMADIGIDTSKPDVQAEANELQGVMTGLAQGMSQFTFTNFDSQGSAFTSHYLEAPEWFDPVYFFTWLVLWVVGLVFISRRGRKKVVT